MSKRMKTIVMGIIVLFLLACYVFVQAQQQKVTLRYKLNVGDIWEYECVTEGEKNYTHDGAKETHLRNIKENFKYEVQEITPEGYFKVKLTETPIESKGVSIIAGEKKEMHDFVAGHEFEEIFINPKGEILRGAFGGRYAVTATVFTLYDKMIEYLHPIMPEGEVGINDTWNYPIALIPKSMPGPVFRVWIDWYGQFPTSINYQVVGFENKDGFDCAKIEYNYLYDETDKLNKIIAVADEETKGEILKDLEHRKEEIIIKGTGALYFAYNESFVVSRKENLMKTDIESKLVNENWEIYKKTIERIGFTMNYIKP